MKTEVDDTSYFYRLISQDTPSVRLSLSGVISSRTNTLDRETKSQYVVVVKAQDMRGMPSGSTSTTSVTITVGDTNDNHASFTQSKATSREPKVPIRCSSRLSNVFKAATFTAMSVLCLQGRMS